MPTTTRAADIPTRAAVPHLFPRTHTPLSFYLKSCTPSVPRASPISPPSVLSSSLPPSIPETRIPSPNGLVHTILAAYTNHNHLIIRPEDVWFAILTQFSFYVGRHVEEMREWLGPPNTGGAVVELQHGELQAGRLLESLSELAASRVKDPAFLDWIMPDFTTTTDDDRIAASILALGTLHPYTHPDTPANCGLPSVTLLGEREDYVDILSRLDFLARFSPQFNVSSTPNPEIKLWDSILTGVLLEMVHTFDAPDAADTARFWTQAVISWRDGVSGKQLIGGWALAFCFWAPDGEALLVERIERMTPDWIGAVVEHGLGYWFSGPKLGFLEVGQVPAAFASVDVVVKAAEWPLPSRYMVRAMAGCVGFDIRDSAEVFRWTRGVRAVEDAKSLSSFSMRRPRRGWERGRVSEYKGVTIVEIPVRKGLWGKIMRALVDKREVRRCRKQVVKEKRVEGLRCSSPSEELATTHTSLCKGKAKKPKSRCHFPPNSHGLPEPNLWEEMLLDQLPPASDIGGLDKEWEYEGGAMDDSRQPVTGWWLVRQGGELQCPETVPCGIGADIDEGEEEWFDACCTAEERQILEV